jgi:hypothetical protein
VRQIAALTHKSETRVIDAFNDLKGGTDWQQEGLNGEDLKAYAIAFGHPFWFIANNTLLSLYEPKADKSGRGLACVAYDGHAFFLKCCSTVTRWKLHDTISLEEKSILQNEIKSKIPPLDEWKKWNGVCSPGYFHTNESLPKVRQALLFTGRSPKVQVKDTCGIAALRYQCVQKVDNSTGMCIIRQLPPEAEAIQAWLKNLPVSVPYCGEGLAGITLKVFHALLKSERKAPRVEEKNRLLKQQKNKCNECGEEFNDETAAQWDHIVPLRQLPRGAAQRFQAICGKCHEEKTLWEGRQDRTIESCFSQTAWDWYVRSQWPAALVWIPGSYIENPETQIALDVTRCRRQAMCKSPHDFCIFSPLDNTTEAVSGRIVRNLTKVNGL